MDQFALLWRYVRLVLVRLGSPFERKRVCTDIRDIAKIFMGGGFIGWIIEGSAFSHCVLVVVVGLVLYWTGTITEDD